LTKTISTQNKSMGFRWTACAIHHKISWRLQERLLFVAMPLRNGFSESSGKSSNRPRLRAATIAAMPSIFSTRPPATSVNLRISGQRIQDHLATWTDVHLHRSRRAWLARSSMCSAAMLLTACGLTGPFPGVPGLNGPGRNPPYKGEVAPPQVAYRIDENRYFEIVPYGPGACTNAMVHFVDTAKGIRSEAVKLDPGSMGAATLIIDASNDQYLVAPVTRGNTDCSSGGGLCGGSKLPYSTDGGRTWKRANPRFTNGFDLYLAGDELFYAGQKVKLSRLADDDSVWPRYYVSDSNPLPPIRQGAIDRKFHCTPNGKE
jgi:hypothetical protein